MKNDTPGFSLSRRKALRWGANLGASFMALSLSSGSAARAQSSSSNSEGEDAKHIFESIEDIIQAQGMFSDGVFSIEIDRDDINNVTLQGVPILPSFQINGSLYFQKIESDDDGDPSSFIMNSDMVLKAAEIDPFIDQLLAHNIVFQAEHQHFYDFDPLVWFIHFRATGDPITIAHGVKAALNVTSTPFPQTMPSNPTTPLPADAIGQILGASPSIGANGVVNFNVPRRESITLGGVRINPYLNVATPIAFQPYNGRDNAAAIPDFGMVASEINTVVSVMRGQGWDIGCLYNQETDEHPQLYFSHQFKTGGAIQLAQEIRNGLNHMDVKFLS